MRHWLSRFPFGAVAVAVLSLGAASPPGAHADDGVYVSETGPVQKTAPEQLMAAVELGDAAMVRSLLESGVDPNRRTPAGKVVLGYVPGLAPDANEILALLLKHGARIDRRDGLGRTPLMNAAFDNDVKVMKVLLARGASLRAKDADGRSVYDLGAWTRASELLRRFRESDALIEAAMRGNAARVNGLLVNGTYVGNRDALGHTALDAAVEFGQVRAVRQLLAAGANPRTKNDVGQTVMEIALSRDSAIIDGRARSQIIGALLDAGADADLPLSSGVTPLVAAISHGDAFTVRVLLTYGAEPDQVVDYRTPLSYAAELDHLDVIEALLQGGADPNQRDSNGLSPIEVARKIGNEPIAARLASAGGRPEDLFGAAARGDVTQLDALLRAGAGIDARRAGDGMTALMIAVQKRNLEAVDYLLGRGADVDVQNGQRATALHVAVQVGDADAAKRLVGRSANLDAMGPGGRTPMMMAIASGRFDIAASLLAAKPKLDLKDEAGDTALMLAADQGRLDLVEALLAAGARRDLENRDGRTAKDFAQLRGYDEIVQALDPIQ